MATIKDVAALSGVSVTTVSRVLNKRGYISEDTYKKVYDAMAKLNYQPNQLARSLSKQKTNFIGLLVPDVSHPFFAEMTHLHVISLCITEYEFISMVKKRNFKQMCHFCKKRMRNVRNQKPYEVGFLLGKTAGKLVGLII